MRSAESSVTILYLIIDPSSCIPTPKLKHSLNYQGESRDASETPGHMDKNYAQKLKHAFFTLDISQKAEKRLNMHFFNIQRAINNNAKS